MAVVSLCSLAIFSKAMKSLSTDASLLWRHKVFCPPSFSVAPLPAQLTSDSHTCSQLSSFHDTSIIPHAFKMIKNKV